MKQVEVQQGKYQGKLAVIVGTDKQYFGRSVMTMREPIGYDYVERWAHQPWGLLDKVYIAQIDGQLVALNNAELQKPKEKPEQKAEPAESKEKK